MNKLLAAFLLMLAVAQTQAVAANFSVAGGYLIDPTGAKFVPEGTNVDEYNMADILQDEAGYPATTMLPKLNYIRVIVHPISFNATPPTIATYPNPANYQAMANLCQSAKIVCEFEDHGSNGGYWEDNTGHFYGQSFPPTGTLLNNTLTFWTAMAIQFKNNPYAWIGSFNELGSKSYSVADLNAISDYQLALYNAIRSTGNNNIIDLCAGNGCGNKGTVGSNALKASNYANMTNVTWQLHAYMNDTEANVLNTLNGTTAPNQDGGPGCYGWKCAQTIQSKDGVMPVIYNEFGSTVIDKNSSTGQGIASAMTDLQAHGVGSAAYEYYNPNGPNPLVGSDFTQIDNAGYLKNRLPPGQSYTLTVWGRIVAKLIAANPYPGRTGGR
jgi:Cellulase (glycosyl hydrolase family 5)